MLYWSLVAGAYVFGSLSSAILLCKLMGYPDPRTGGSGNPGATNILRLHGKGAAMITLIGDLLKGLAPVAIARAMDAPPEIVAATGVAAFLGHLFPLFFGFRGGKGIATFIGAMAGYSWLLGAGFMSIWLLVAVTFRYSSLSALVSATASPILVSLLLPGPSYLLATSFMVLLIFWRHRPNIQKLLAGTERKIGAKAE